MPPVDQPEIAAEPIYWAARHRRRELYVGISTLISIIGDKIAPSLGDLYLSWTGYGSQQHDGVVGADRRDNLFVSLPGEWGAHGDFDERAKEHSRELWLSMHRGSVTAGITVVPWLCGLPLRP